MYGKVLLVEICKKVIIALRKYLVKLYSQLTAPQIDYNVQPTTTTPQIVSKTTDDTVKSEADVKSDNIKSNSSNELSKYLNDVINNTIPHFTNGSVGHTETSLVANYQTTRYDKFDKQRVNEDYYLFDLNYEYMVDERVDNDTPFVIKPNLNPDAKIQWLEKSQLGNYNLVSNSLKSS